MSGEFHVNNTITIQCAKYILMLLISFVCHSSQREEEIRLSSPVDSMG